MYVVGTFGVVGHPGLRKRHASLFGGVIGTSTGIPRMKILKRVIKTACERVKTIVARKLAVCPGETLQTDPEQDADVIDVGPKIDPHVDHQFADAGALKTATIKINPINFVILWILFRDNRND